MLESPTFKKLWLAMALAPAKQFTYTFEVTDFDGMMEFSAGNNGTGQTICGMRGCITKVNSDAINTSVLIDEFVHAAGGADAETAKKAGVPQACAYHGPAYGAAGCGDIREKIEKETADAEKKKSSTSSEP